MRITRVTEEAIIFNNGNKITYFHSPDCCEHNYADFSVLNPNVINYNYDFDENLDFQIVEGMGFKFGSNGHWIFIPCYSEQNGYYSHEVGIYYSKQVFALEAQAVDNY